MSDVSFQDFVSSRWPALVRFAWTLTGDRGHAEDVVQVVLERCWTRWAVIQGGGAQAYVRASIVNEVISRQRRSGRRPRETSMPDKPEPGSSNVRETGQHGDGFAEDQARATIVWQELQALPVRMRAVVVLRFLEDMSEAATADILGCSVGTVKSQTSRAMSRLRDRAGLRDLMGMPQKETT